MVISVVHMEVMVDEIYNIKIHLQVLFLQYLILGYSPQLLVWVLYPLTSRYGKLFHIVAH